MSNLLKLLNNPTNQRLLQLLQVEPTFARRAAKLLACSESEVTRRFRALERAGLIEGVWTRTDRNIKMYRPAADGIHISFGKEGMLVEMANKSRQRIQVVDVEEVPEGEMYGREDELKALANANVALVFGIPGLGKTSLLAAHCRSLNVPVAWATARGAESIQYLANRWAQSLRNQGDSDLAAALRAMTPVAALQHCLDGHRCLVVDDAHLLPDETKRALREVYSQRVSGLAIAGRTPIAHPPRADWVLRIDLDGLPEAATSAWLHASGIRDGDASDLCQRLEGHPLAIQLAIQLALRRNESISQVVAAVPHEGLDEFLLEALDEQLSAVERATLGACSVFRSTFRSADVRAVWSQGRRSDLMRLHRDGLLMRQGDAWRLHGVVREHFYRRLDGRAAFHRAAGERILATPNLANHVEALWHFWQANDEGMVATLLRRNLDVREVASLDSGAAELYQSMLRVVAPKDPALAALVQDELGDLAFARQDWHAALEHYDRAEAHFKAHPEGWEDEDLAWKRAQCLEAVGQLDAATQCVTAAIQTAPPGRVLQRLEALDARLREIAQTHA